MSYNPKHDKDYRAMRLKEEEREFCESRISIAMYNEVPNQYRRAEALTLLLTVIEKPKKQPTIRSANRPVLPVETKGPAMKNGNGSSIQPIGMALPKRIGKNGKEIYAKGSEKRSYE